MNLPGTVEVVTLVVVPNVNCVLVDGAVVLTFNAVPSGNGDTDVVAAAALEPNERFNGVFAVALLPSEKPKGSYLIRFYILYTIASKLPGLVEVAAKVVVAPNEIDEVVGAFKFPNDENVGFVVGLTAATGLPKLDVVAAVVDDGKPPRDEPKPNCGLLKNCFNRNVIHWPAILFMMINNVGKLLSIGMINNYLLLGLIIKVLQ